MKSFQKYILESKIELVEKLITFGGKAYPKFGNVVIMAGGAGSGKGFVKDKLVGIEGRVFDVDELKKLAAKSEKIKKRVKDEYNMDIEDIASDLKDPQNVYDLHMLIGDELKVDNRRKSAMMASILTADPKRKPNLIFDVTLKNINKLNQISQTVSKVGYNKSNIHIVWVVNDIQVAIKQNKERDRVVPQDILVNTHRGVSATMHDIVNMGKNLSKYMDGDIVFAFNKVGVDTDVEKSSKGGMYIKDANYFYVKRTGKKPLSIQEISKDLRYKIKSYVPKDVDWLE